MKIYETYSEAFGSDIRLTYNNNGVLIRYEVIDEDLAATQSLSLFAKIIINEGEFLRLAKEYGLKFKEKDREITFEMFYERYGYKVDKTLALAEWNKLLKQEQLAAYDHIPKYYAQLKLNGGLGRKYPVRYLKHKPWVQ